MVAPTTVARPDDAGIDLTQFHGLFFDEAGENLDTMERLLLHVDFVNANDEELNAIFRCAHSIKGGAAAFGFGDVAELTHRMETLLDKLRRHELAPSPAMVDVLLRSGDALKALLQVHKGTRTDMVETAALVHDMRLLSEAGAAVAAPQKVAAPVPAAQANNSIRLLELTVGPLLDPAQADNLEELFREVIDLGRIEPLDAGHAADGMRRFKVTTSSSDDDLLDLFSFHVDREFVRLAPLGPGFGLVEPSPGTPREAAPIPRETDGITRSKTAAVRADARGLAAAGETTLRVSIDKVDQLINLVGELVITQAMLAQTSANIDTARHKRFASSLAELERNTRDLQESVMSIRMIPMSGVFNRFPRMLRDLAGKLGKQVEFATQGEATELDKGLVEKITDPLTHLVRNSCDHGIEMPEERLARGKPPAGTITLAASHQGGNIVIEVRDDGRGLNRSRLLQSAREKGLDVPDSLSDPEVWNLIFAPGFSTAEVVSEISGRGVGMDVVKRNILALGGTVEIDSVEGSGMSVKVRLPLTLAIMESLSVGVGEECYVLPLASVIESFQPAAGQLKSVGGHSRLVRVRDEYLPVIELERVLDVPRRGHAPIDNPVLVVIEADGTRSALLVDEILGQQQVVVKNLEANFRRVQHVSGATIMGDGQVALILDVDSLVRPAPG